jgi:hypothetical protein
MSAEIVATSQNIKNISTMLTKLETVKDDASKLREISLDSTGWEGMDASSFNTALNNFTQKLDKTTNDIADALNVYLKKQEEQLENGDEAAKTAANLIENFIEAGQEKIRQQKQKKEEKQKEQKVEKYEKNQKNELYSALNEYYDFTKALGLNSYIIGTDKYMKEKLQQMINKYPGNDITPKQLNEIIKEYGPDGFTRDEVEQIWNDNYKG